MNNISIQNVNEQSPYLKDIIALGDANKQTLGFLPESVFIEQAMSLGIIVAVTQDGQCVGYLMYNLAKRNRHVRIMHLCVDKKFRGLGIAKRLNDYLIEKTKDIAYGIKLSCRKDYPISQMWPRLGYVAISEKPGRKKSGSTLVNWWLDHHHPLLFDLKKEDLSVSLRVAIDSRIFYELSSREEKSNRESSNREVELLELDWLNEEVVLGVTEEIFTEINRDFKTQQEKVKKRLAVDKFNLIKSTLVQDGEVLSTLESLSFTNCAIPEIASCLRHITRCVNAGVPIFLTLNKDLLSLQEAIQKISGILVLKPSELLIRLDDILKQVQYQPVHLAGLEFKSQTISEVSDLALLLSIFSSSDSTEPEENFRKYLYDSAQGLLRSQLITHNKRPIALVISDMSSSKEAVIRCLRATKSSYSNTILRHVLFQFITQAVQDKIAITKVMDSHISEDVGLALQDSNFIALPNSSEWVKIHYQCSAELENASRALAELSSLHRSYKLLPMLLTKMSDSNFLNDSISISDVEKLLWPLKILDAEQPSFIIPITPKWAKELFDYKLANQTLFGASNPEVFLNTESVYYRSQLPTGGLKPNICGRILWYVSKGRHREYVSTQAIRACSQIDEILVDYPERLYNRFSRLGIYELSQLIEISKAPDGSRKIMAIKFSNTEIFQNPIHLARVRDILQNQAPLQSPYKISPRQFSEIYMNGMLLVND